MPYLVLVAFTQPFERKVDRFVAGMRQPGETVEGASLAGAAPRGVTKRNGNGSQRGKRITRF